MKTLLVVWDNSRECCERISVNNEERMGRNVHWRVRFPHHLKWLNLIKWWLSINWINNSFFNRTPWFLESWRLKTVHQLHMWIKKRDNTAIIPSCGAEGSRTLVQLWDKLYLLHAYFSVNFREINGLKTDLIYILRYFVSL